MSLFVIDEKKCKRDGICAQECPRMIIEFTGDGSVPRPAEHAETTCIHCGHCVAVCPHGALSLVDMKTEDCPAVETKDRLSPEGIERVIRSRRSIRTYKDKEVERDTLERLVSCARYAPTGMNRQEVEWIVVHSRDGVRKLSGMAVDWMRDLVDKGNPTAQAYGMPAIVAAWEAGKDIICRGAPGLVITHAPRDFGTAGTDCTIALSFLDIAAPSFGLGTCCAGFFMYGLAGWPPLRDDLGIPEGNAAFGAMMVGYPKYAYHRLPLRRPPRIRWYP